MDKTLSVEALREAIRLYPTLKAFSEALGLRYQVVQQWLTNGVPADYCPDIERLTNGVVRCERLRSSVDWTYLRDQQHAAQPRALTCDRDRRTKPGRRVDDRGEGA